MRYKIAIIFVFSLLALVSAHSVSALPGDIDTSFGSDGVVITSLGELADLAGAVSIQSDGKIVVAGASHNGEYTDAILVRYNTDGSLDPAFGDQGIVRTDIGSGHDHATSLKIQSDGKLVITGYTITSDDRDFFVARYNADGSPDNAFGSSGVVTKDLGATNDSSTDLAIQTDGKLIVVGFFPPGNADIFLFRFNADGTTDNSFGNDGLVTTVFSDYTDVAASVALQTDGKIVVTGHTGDLNGHDLQVVRYNSDGSLDDAFGSGGRVTVGSTGSSEMGNFVLIQPDGKIVAAGAFDGDIGLVRIDSDGSLDNSFGLNGVASTPLGNKDEGRSAALQTDGKLVVAGYSFAGEFRKFTVIRFNSNGSLDESFGTGGVAIDSIGNNHDYADSVAIQNDGKIVLAGFSDLNTKPNIALVRHLGGAAYKLDIDLAGNGGGGVVSFPPGIDCAMDCSKYFDDGTVVYLTSTPTLGSTFGGWSNGDCSGFGVCELVVDASKSAEAEFNLITYTVKFNAEPGGGLTGELSQIVEHGNDCAPVAAVPDTGFHFAGWKGGYEGTENPLLIQNTTSDLTITGTFSLNTYLITATASIGGSIYPPGEIIVEHGSDRTLTISPDPGYVISQVTVDGATQGAIGHFTFNDVSENHAIHADFILNTIPTTVSASPAGGIYNKKLQVVLTAAGPSSDICVINYSQGAASDPISNGAQYEGPLNIEQSTTFKFLALLKNGVPVSPVFSETYTIDTVPPDAPESLNITRNGQNDPQPDFSWSSVSDAGSYQFQLADNANFDPMMIDLAVISTAYQLTSDQALNQDGLYYARVRAVDQAGNSSGWEAIGFSYAGEVKVRKAIILAGKAEDDLLWPITGNTCDFVFGVLEKRGFDPEDITYLTSDLLNLKRDGQATAAAFQSAIDQSSEADQLVIFMHDHGAEGLLWLNKADNEFVTTAELDAWLGELEAKKPGIEIILIYEACYSGSFVFGLGGQGRVVITSSAEDEIAYLVPSGELSFSWIFFSRVYSGANLRDAYMSAVNEISFSFNAKQNPMADADGDGLANEDADKIILARTHIGYDAITASDRPVIGGLSISPGPVLGGVTTATLTATDVAGSTEIVRVWAVIHAPDYTPPDSGQAALNLPTLELEPGGPNAWTGAWNRFTSDGVYRVVVYALDRAGLISSFRELIIYQGQGEYDQMGLIGGWNLVSLRLSPIEADIDSVLASIAGRYSTIWAYTGGRWQFYDPGNKDFSDLKSMTAGIGYWIRMADPGTLGLFGTPSSTSCALNPGWNLVGYSAASAQTTADALASIDGQYESVWCFKDGEWLFYDPVNPEYSDLLQMEPGYGYWIKAKAACTWTLP